MATTARIARVLIVATGILVLSVSAAQARPAGLGYSASQATARPSNVYHGFYGPQALYKADAAKASRVDSAMTPAVDPPNLQQTPIVVASSPQPVKIDSGFDWTAGMLGAGVATLALLLAAITASRIRQERVAQI